MAKKRTYAEIAADNRDYQKSFEMFHRRLRKAEKLWQKETQNPNVGPDLGELMEWLLKRAESYDEIARIFDFPRAAENFKKGKRK